jgi:pilus assembly protein FimV
MSRCLTRISLALVLLLSSEVWAIGLGDINLDSALNEPLRAEIELLSATPEELANLTVSLASAETFARYGIDRPFFLQEIEFNVQPTGPSGAVVQIRSRSPITEPFVTFLVEATWSSGRLLREYTVLLDPPTYAPPAVQQAPVVEAPRRAPTTDTARIERQQPAPQPVQREEPQPAQPRVTPPTAARDETEAPPPAPAAESSYSRAPSGDYYVERGDTLWGIASRMRPDSRLSMNQTMLAIFEANPGAFSNNINRLSAGASLRIPSADEVFQISRGDAFSEVKRQNAVWSESAGVPSPDAAYPDTTPDTDYTAPDTDYSAPDETTDTRPNLQLVPPDEEPVGIDYDEDIATSEPPTREQEIEDRIADLEAADVPDQQSLIEIRDNELATLRQELAEIRGETYEAPVDDTASDEVADEDLYGDDELIADTDDDVAGDDLAVDDETTAADDEVTEPVPAPTDVIRTPRASSDPSIMDRVMAILGSFWTKIVAALILVAGVLLWFVRRGRDEDDDSSPWETLDKDELAAGAMSATETLRAPVHDDESIVVVEQESGMRPTDDDTIEAPTPEPASLEEPTGDTGEFGSLEDTFSSETAVNLDQSDPLAEADFHMAYGLYDQAADLVNGALEADPTDQALMSKLCEIYFVWGNQDAFIDAATRLNTALAGSESPEWDKIVIMGQQIAADHALFAGAGVAGATKAVDLSFEAEMDDAAELDMDFGGDSGADSDIIDLGGDLDADATAADDGAVDFLFDAADDESVDLNLEDTAESPTVESPADIDVTAEMPAPVEPTVETPTIEQQFEGLGSTSELPSLDEDLLDSGQETDATAEINLDELDLDITGTNEALEDTGINEALADLDDISVAGSDDDSGATSISETLNLDDIQDLDSIDSTGMRLAPDETGASPMLRAEEETDASLDIDLLEATGRTQILSEDFAVDTQSDVDAGLGDDEATMLAPGYGDEDAEIAMDEDTAIASDAETMLAPMDEDEDDYDFAKTEALPPEAFTGNTSLDETGEMPAVAGTDVDLDLDDLTAALAVSEIGDTVEQPRDDATVEQPRPVIAEETAEVPTMSIAPEDMSDDLQDARTMTEVGTKLDLARAYVDMGDPAGARSILEEVLDEGDEGQKQQAQQLLDSLPS